MGYLKIIIAILIWSSLGIFIRNIGLPNVAIVFYSCAIAGVIQWILLLLKGQFRKDLDIANRVHKILLLIAIPVCTIANTLLFYFAFKHTTIANAVLAHYTAPIFVAILAPIFLKEKSHKTTWLAIVLSSIGLWLMLWMPSSGGAASMSVSERYGIIAGACSGIAYAFLILILRVVASQYLSLVIIFLQNSIVAVLLLPFVFTIPVSMQSLPYLIAMGVLHSTIAPLIYVQGFQSVKANDAAILGYFEPIGATILAFIFLNELPGLTALFGGSLILLSGYLIFRDRGK
ncbi:MAG: DMT family transporter [Nitrospirae bacterium]|nr:DMT family transporter [Nitrospirota bacterium]